MRNHTSPTTAALVSIFLVLIQTSTYAAEALATVEVHQHRILLTPEQRRVYHDCLTQDWTAEWCRGHSWGIFSTYDRTYAECVAAQHHGWFVVNGRPRFVNMEGYCWGKAHRFSGMLPLK
jgi:hypothetical protein